VVLPALAVLALVTIVGIAATGSTPGGSDRSRAPSDSLLDALFTLWLVAAAAGGVLLVYGLMQRQAIAQQVASRRYPRFTLLGFLFFAGLIAVIVRLFSNWRPLQPPTSDESPAFSNGKDVPTSPDHKPNVDYHPGISWLVVGVVGFLAVAAICAYVVSRRRSRVTDASAELSEQLALALDDALEDLRAEPDPRRAIVAAYARMERVLAAGGVPRQSAETPDEYLGRVLNELTPGSDAVARLTALFTQAKFSHHEVDATMKEEAIEALEQVRDELRQRSAEPVAEGDATPAEVRP
jgi:hypothetical protein